MLTYISMPVLNLLLVLQNNQNNSFHKKNSSKILLLQKELLLKLKSCICHPSYFPLHSFFLFFLRNQMLAVISYYPIACKCMGINHPTLCTAVYELFIRILPIINCTLLIIPRMESIFSNFCIKQ